MCQPLSSLAFPEPLCQHVSSPFFRRERMVITSGPEMSSLRLAIVIGPRAGVCWVMYLAEELSGLVCSRVHLGVCTSAERETLLVGTWAHWLWEATEVSQKTQIEGTVPTHPICSAGFLLRTDMIRFLQARTQVNNFLFRKRPCGFPLNNAYLSSQLFRNPI